MLSLSTTKRDISLVDYSEIVRHQAHLWLMSPSCQPYTILNPQAKGAQDPRAASFLHLMLRVLPDIHQHAPHDAPQWLLIENVAGFEVLFVSERFTMSIRTVPQGIDHPRRRFTATIGAWLFRGRIPSQSDTGGHSQFEAQILLARNFEHESK